MIPRPIAHGLTLLTLVVGLALIASAQAPSDAGRDAERDRRFEAFVRRSAGTMVSDIAVETERHLKVKVRNSVPPEETLPLCNSLMAGARKDFPDQIITIAVYDPSGAAILRSRYRPGHGVDHEVVHGGGAHTRPSGTMTSAPGAPKSTTTTVMPRSGRTAKDQKYAAWAEEKGKDYLRYVEADLENHGRLWFGVTKAVKPADVRGLTQSLLEGARTEFPRRELTATVFDPDGQKIGKATLGADGTVHWST